MIGAIRAVLRHRQGAPPFASVNTICVIGKGSSHIVEESHEPEIHV
jgi:hypothetical protein